MYIEYNLADNKIDPCGFTFLTKANWNGIYSLITHNNRLDKQVNKYLTAKKWESILLH